MTGGSLCICSFKMATDVQDNFKSVLLKSVLHLGGCGKAMQVEHGIMDPVEEEAQ